jgi:hypothetical protein
MAKSAGLKILLAASLISACATLPIWAGEAQQAECQVPDNLVKTFADITFSLVKLLSMISSESSQLADPDSSAAFLPMLESG